MELYEQIRREYEHGAGTIRAVAQKHQGQAGLYMNVIRPGVIRVGDPIRLVSKL